MKLHEASQAEPMPSKTAEKIVAPTGREAAGTRPLEVPDYRTVLIRRTIRSGQKVSYPGNIVIMGDVNPGAEVSAGGNIVVMGTLRGMAHAGVGGNQQAVISALRLQPIQLRIADHITRPPDGEKSRPQQPETARIKDGAVVIETFITDGYRQEVKARSKRKL